MIYFAQPVDGGPIKIGYTTDVKKRIMALQAWYGKRLVVLAEFEGDRKLEAALHKQFDYLRLGTTEQFRPATELLEHIGHHPVNPVDPASVTAMARAEIEPGGRSGVTGKRTGRPRDPAGAKTARYAMRGSSEWHAWLKDVSDKLGVDRSVAIRWAVKSWAETKKFKPPPEE